jgi:transposase
LGRTSAARAERNSAPRQRQTAKPDKAEFVVCESTIYNRFMRWSRLGVFDRIFAGLAGEGPKPERIMIDATHLKAHRTAASLLKKGLFPVVSGARKAA